MIKELIINGAYRFKEHCIDKFIVILLKIIRLGVCLYERDFYRTIQQIADIMLIGYYLLCFLQTKYCVLTKN